MRWRTLSTMGSSPRSSIHLPFHSPSSALHARGPHPLRHLQATRKLLHTSRRPVTIGIRREDPARLWERRVPLTPDAVATLVRDEGVEVVVQSCDRRVFKDAEYRAAGARVEDALTDQSIVLGIKEVPISELDTSPVNGRPRTHIMFSHTAKGQPYNLPLLSRFLSAPTAPRLIDYELLTDGNSKRTVAFGHYAGLAGAIEGLHASALDLLEVGVASPFLHLPRPFAHPSLSELKASLRGVGQYIAEHGTPPAAGPFVIAVTGSGNVANGALDMLQELPIQQVEVDALKALVADPNTDLKKVYLVHALPQSYILHNDGRTPYSRSDYYATPGAYQSVFHETVAPYISLLINGAGWQPGFPRLMTTDQLGLALSNADAVEVGTTRTTKRGPGAGRFRSVADVSCDVEGGLEFVSRSTTISEPTYTAFPTNTNARSGRGVQVMAVDILPTEIPLDASRHFSEKLMPYLRTLIQLEQGGAKAGEGLEEALDRATIARGGQLMSGHEWLYDLLEKAGLREGLSTPSSSSSTSIPLSSAPLSATSSSSSASSNSATTNTTPSLPPRPKRILLFGSGMVARPFCETVWSAESSHELVIASNNIKEARALIKGKEDVTSVVEIDVGNARPEEISKLVEGVDVVVSLLPAPLHPSIATHCLEHRKHLVTASYISPAMKELHERAVDADVIFLNEIGLDPGIDHMSAMEMRDRLVSEGKRIVSFISWCGGLPAPEDSNVPLGMKFSWSPKALLSAALNEARFKMNHTMHHIPGSSLLSSHFPSVPIAPGFAFEGLANRNSLPYASSYSLGPLESLETVFRGTLRYEGFSDLLGTMRAIGLLSSAPEDKMTIRRWDELGAKAIEKSGGTHFGREIEDGLVALGLLPGLPATDLPPIPSGSHTPMDLLSALLSHKLRYHSGERDMVILSHEIITESLSDSRPSREIHTSNLITYGQPGGNSAMSRTVGIPLACATLRIVSGEVATRGVCAPVESEIYAPVLRDLRDVHGIVMKENTKAGRGMVALLRRN